MKLNKRPAQVDAIQFTGGIDSATEVINFLYAHGIMDATYQTQVLDDGEEIRAEAVIAHRPGNVSVRNWWVIFPNRWVVIGEESGPYATSTENLFAYYEEP